MQPLDWAIVAAYFGILFGLAWWVIKQNKDSADDYFLAGRNLGWFIIGASIFASNIGSEHLVGLAGSGCTDGVALAHFELHAWCLLVLGWVMIPFYTRSKVFTMPEFLERRYSPSARYILSVISLIAYVLTKIAVGIFAGGVVFGTLLPELKLEIGSHVLNSFWIGSILVIVLTGAYTILGGLRAVAYTEALQSIVLIIGSVLVAVFGLIKLGGFTELRNICGSEMFNLWKPLIPEGMQGTWAPVIEKTRIAWYFNGNYPWIGMLFCAPIAGLWYWCTDQYIVQRTLGAPNEREARRGTIFAALLKLLPVFIFIIPGMICFALAKSGKVAEFGHLLDPSGATIGEECQAAFPLMVKYALPVGIRGIVVAGLLSALMSSLAGVFNASSTLLTMDLYRRFRPGASQKQLIWVGRIATAAMVVIGLAWIPVIQGARGLYDYLQGISAYLAPPIFVVFFFGIASKRLNSRGCIATMVIGFMLGLFRLVIDTPVKLGLSGFENGYTEGSFLWFVNNVYFQYYSLFIFLVSIVVMLTVSWFTAVPSRDKLDGLTFATLSESDRAESRSSWNWVDVSSTILVLAGIVSAYIYFSG